jgi:hypothetical protein
LVHDALREALRWGADREQLLNEVFSPYTEWTWRPLVHAVPVETIQAWSQQGYYVLFFTYFIIYLIIFVKFVLIFFKF